MIHLFINKHRRYLGESSESSMQLIFKRATASCIVRYLNQANVRANDSSLVRALKALPLALKTYKYLQYEYFTMYDTVESINHRYPDEGLVH